MYEKRLAEKQVARHAAVFPDPAVGRDGAVIAQHIILIIAQRAWFVIAFFRVVDVPVQFEIEDPRAEAVRANPRRLPRGGSFLWNGFQRKRFK